MQIGTEELCDEIAAPAVSRGQTRGERERGRGLRQLNTYISSRGEMKMSLREMT